MNRIEELEMRQRHGGEVRSIDRRLTRLITPLLPDPAAEADRIRAIGALLAEAMMVARAQLAEELQLRLEVPVGMDVLLTVQPDDGSGCAGMAPHVHLTFQERGGGPGDLIAPSPDRDAQN